MVVPRSNGRRPRVRLLHGEDYPDWRKFRRQLSGETQKLLAAAERNGCHVYLLDGNVPQHQQLIFPHGEQPYVVGFRDLDAERHPEFVVKMHPNALSVEYLDPTLAARPPYPTFTVGNGKVSYFPALEEMYPHLGGDELQRDAFEWLSKRDLIVFLFLGDDGNVRGEFVAPREMSHVVQGYAMIHRVPTYKELHGLGKPNTTMWAAPGLRHSLFDGQQNVTLFPEDNGNMLMISNSSYEGLLEKKPEFCDISYKRGIRGGMALHASLVLCLMVALTIAIICDSGRGKTELRMRLAQFIDKGRVLLGFRRNGGGKLRRLSFSWPWDLEWRGLGDDGLVIRSLRRFKKSGKNGFFRAKNWENGAFDRNSGAHRQGDIPELDRMQEASRGWWELRMINILGEVGDRIYHWNRVLIDGKPCSNPRVLYSNALLRRVGVDVRKQEVPVQTVFYAFAPVDGVSAVGPWTKLPGWLAAVYEILGGPDAVRSKSVGPGVPQGKVVTVRRVKFGHRGTNAQFDPTEFPRQTSQVLQRICNFRGVAHFLVRQEQKPGEGELERSLTTAEQEVEYVPEVLLRDVLALCKAGKASITWQNSPYPFLGMTPKTVKVGGRNLPQEWLSPEKMYGEELQERAQAWYDEVCAEMEVLEKKGVDPNTLRLFEFLRGIYPDGRVHRMSRKEVEEVMRAGDALLASFEC